MMSTTTQMTLTHMYAHTRAHIHATGSYRLNHDLVLPALALAILATLAILASCAVSILPAANQIDLMPLLDGRQWRFASMRRPSPTGRIGGCVSSLVGLARRLGTSFAAPEQNTQKDQDQGATASRHRHQPPALRVLCKIAHRNAFLDAHVGACIGHRIKQNGTSCKLSASCRVARHTKHTQNHTHTHSHTAHPQANAK